MQKKTDIFDEIHLYTALNAYIKVTTGEKGPHYMVAAPLEEFTADEWLESAEEIAQKLSATHQQKFASVKQLVTTEKYEEAQQLVKIALATAKDRLRQLDPAS